MAIPHHAYGDSDVVGWQPIATAPKTGLIDLWVPRYPSDSGTHPGFRVADAAWDGSGWVATSTGKRYKAHQPSHWMPRPKPPATDNHNRGASTWRRRGGISGGLCTTGHLRRSPMKVGPEAQR